MSAVTMNSVVLEKLRQACKSLEHDCEVEEQQLGLRFNFSDECVVVARPNHENSTVKFIATGFHAISKAQVSEANLFLAWANARICMGNLALEMESLELRFYLDMPYEFATSDAEVERIAHKSLGYVLTMFRQHRAAFELISINEVSFDQALELIVRRKSLPLEDSFGKLLTLVKGMSSSGERLVTDRAKCRITIFNRDESGVSQETTIRLDVNVGTLFIITVFSGLDREQLQNAVNSYNATQTRDQFGRASMDRKRQELIISGAISVTRDLICPAEGTEVHDFFREHFKSAASINSLAMPAAMAA